MLTSEQQERLTRVGPGTPMGELLRRYWMPVLASSDLACGAIRKVRLLCEDLVLYRNTKANLGMLDESCPHRGTSLAYGCVDNEGIRCPYHGWKFDAAGRCLELPAEPADSKLYNTVRANSYRVQELGGLIFAYLGPEPAPLLPRYDLYAWDNVLRDIGHALIPCNWLQIMENSVDPHHVEWLHGHQLAATRQQQGMPVPNHYRRKQIRTGFDEFEYGIIKRRVLEGGSEEDDDWKIGHPLIFPNMLRVGAYRQHRFQIRVPVDDTHTLHFWYSCYVPESGKHVPSQVSIPAYAVEWQDEDGDFLVDFVDGQDIMSWVTQGPIADRTREILGSSDRGIALYRRLLFKQLEIVEASEDPMGIIRDADRNQIVELPQEREKYGRGKAFLEESIAMSHVRYSPIRDLILEVCSG
jgi:5,5'-dehydrodivanillate O-demethylase oxygenase subunit